MSDEDFGLHLRQWRKAQRVKQITLAEEVGVTQAAISRWENGIDRPSGPFLRRLRTVMGRFDSDVSAEKLYVQRLPDIRGLFDFDGARLLASSQGMSALWPSFAAMIGQSFADHMAGETAWFVQNRETANAIRSGDLLFASGVSQRHLNLDVDTEVRHRWSVRPRLFGSRVLVEIAFGPCSQAVTPGVEELLYRDDFAV